MNDTYKFTDSAIRQMLLRQGAWRAISLFLNTSIRTITSTALESSGIYMPNEPDFQKLYEMAVNEEHVFLEAHHHRVQFYSSLISAVIAATVTGAVKAVVPFHYLLLTTGPVLVVGLSLLALEGTFRLYQRFLEAVAVRAKLEQAMGLTKISDKTSTIDGYWTFEPLITGRHLEDRMRYSSSLEFIKSHHRSGYQKVTRILFITLAIVGFVLEVFLITASLK